MALVQRTAPRSRSTLGVLVLASLTLLALGQEDDGGGAVGSVRGAAVDALAPVRAVAGAVLTPVRSAVAGATGAARLEEEADRLRAEVAALEGAAARGEAAEREAAELRRLHDVTTFTGLERVTARVVAVPVSNLAPTVELDRGADDGITEGMPVVTGAGLAGRVVGVSGRRAVVRLLTDPATVVGVRGAASGELGVAEGSGAGRPLAVGLVETTTPLADGELLVTGGAEGGSALPAGIPVGRVVSATARPGQLEQVVRIEPVADLDHLELVEVLRWPA